MEEAFVKKVFDSLPHDDQESLSRLRWSSLESFGMAIKNHLLERLYLERQREAAAVRTLEGKCYEWVGGHLWRPPFGSPPAFDDLDRVRNNMDAAYNNLWNAILEGAAEAAKWKRDAPFSTAGALPGNPTLFTVATFNASEVPAGTRVFAELPSKE